MAKKWESDYDDRIAELVSHFTVQGDVDPWDLAMALIHTGVHVGAEQSDTAYCNIAVFLSDQIRHAHDLAHGDEEPQERPN